MVRSINAREKLIQINYDLSKQLDNNISIKVILSSVKKRLERIKDTKWQKVDWT